MKKTRKRLTKKTKMKIVKKNTKNMTANVKFIEQHHFYHKK